MVLCCQIREKTINYYSTRYLTLFFFFFLIWNISMLISNRSNIVYIFFWVIINLYELFIIFDILFRIQKLRNQYIGIFRLIFIVLSIPIVLAAILTWTNKTYSPINTTDFYNLILLMSGSIIITRFLLLKTEFIKNIESFFIFTGFILYFSLHILTGNLSKINFLENFNFIKYANLISLIFWLGSLFFIWKIRSKHSL